MKIGILFWNVRGANDRDKRKIIKSVIKSQRVDKGWNSSCLAKFS